jgi:osmotically-inducible protein OsmY
MSDRQLRQEILDVFQWDPCIEARHIGLAVDNGVITLTGAVESENERIATEEAVYHVAGVRSLLDKIEVRPTGAEWQPHPHFEPVTE